MISNNVANLILQTADNNKYYKQLAMLKISN